MRRILVVDDEPDIVELVEYNLKRNGYAVLTAGNGEECLALAKKKCPDLIVLDIMLPEMDGFEVCRMLRESPQTSIIPVIMLTAKTQVEDVIKGLGIGADDYVTKPFSPKVLLARIDAVLRRTAGIYGAEEKPIQISDLVVYPERREVTLGGKQITLTFTEFNLLLFLVTKAGMALSRDRILDAVMGRSAFVIDRNVDVHVKSLRKKLQDYGKLIETVRGVGYKFKTMADDEE